MKVKERINNDINLKNNTIFINSKTVFDLNGEKINIADMINQYKLTKLNCGDNWEKCQRILSNIQNFNENNEKNMAQTKSSYNTVDTGDHVRSILEGKEINNVRNNQDSMLENQNSIDNEGIIQEKIIKSIPNANNENGDFYGVVDPIKNEIILKS